MTLTPEGVQCYGMNMEDSVNTQLYPLADEYGRLYRIRAVSDRKYVEHLIGRKLKHTEYIHHVERTLEMVVCNDPGYHRLLHERAYRLGHQVTRPFISRI